MYDELFEAWRKEKENSDIQALPKGFYRNVAAYIKKIREEKRMLDERTLKGRLIQKEEANVKRMIKELVETRREKIMQKISNGEIVPTAALAEEEENFYKEASFQADSFQNFMENLLQGRLLEKTSTKPSGFMVVRILQELPEIIGADMKTYGPFKPEDIATLPKENAKNLIKQGAAMEVETQ
ncbi:hypothetical protein B6U79_04040 [Candidatus Bathyarchaeota archaeon ex4484_231]|nr:MAG: hypothetical protein B6U79_04040 [Candidatus Bathyarchaeota archaeon ex4484_231]